MNTRRMVNTTVVPVAALWFVAPVFASVVLEGVATGTLFRSGNLLAEDYSGGVPLPDDGSTGVYQVMNIHLYGGGVAHAALSSASIGSASTAIGASNWPTDSTHFLASGDGHNRYEDELTIISDTLSNGTEVVIQFSYHVAFTLDAASSVGSGGGTENRGFVYAKISSSVTSGRYGGGYLDGFELPSADHTALIITDPVINSAEGIFSGAQHVDMLLDTEVGGVIQFAVTTRANSRAAVKALFQSGGFQNQSATGSSSVCLAFGASGIGDLRDTPDIVLMSARTGAPFPATADANAGHAAAGLPALPAPLAGDCDFDGDVDLADYAVLVNCLAGPGGGVAEGCSCFDINETGDVDLFDVAEFQVSFNGP